MKHRTLSYITSVAVISLMGIPTSWGLINVVGSGELDIEIPATLDGVYIDFTDPADPTRYDLYTSEPGSWDINPFFGGAAIGTSDTFLVVSDSPSPTAPILNLAVGTAVDDQSVFVTGYSGSSSHMGTESYQFQSGNPGYIGFSILFDDVQYYGYMSVTLHDDGSTGTINGVWWGENATDAILIPEPSIYALTASGGHSESGAAAAPATPHCLQASGRFNMQTLIALYW